ncbi:alpha/beta-hydrolase [Gloeophyllum trabeum ATCC 11539]|uniref:Alpha/beta-hydrolase n=1 Tax=Gloeophyllum trabeum (strain ATCC 11539 / FP-39264 / Madison 617) TaxID=670483 RepID=S7QMK3_GLOTA|nr:alpha/beta-hydrolase [Gloeophyllum trabeum ATCC 11539]EPQ60796.1 alpha/beta-hydrolase [Gloeophyllum trabeum ATCC 11539]
MRIFSKDVLELSPAQKHLYATETQTNFRLIAKLTATRSRRILSSDDLASPELQTELAELSQFIELSYNVMPVEDVYRHIDVLSRPNFPLETCNAVRESKFLKSFLGKVADLHAFTAHRPAKRQLILAISGTCNLKQVYYDLHAFRTTYPYGKGCSVHAGFWSLYMGIKELALDSIRSAMREHGKDIDEIVIVAHSMGAAVGYLLALDLLLHERELLSSVLKLAFFGAPRVGNTHLAELWCDTVRESDRQYGRPVKEYFVKGYNDGVPSLPPYKLGYRHLTETPLYFSGGRLYHIPPSEREHGLFDVSPDSQDLRTSALYPKGGHNYYNDRDLERSTRRLAWLYENMNKTSDWEEQYYKAMIEPEEAWKSKAPK